MPHGHQAPAPSAEGPTQHTQNQADTRTAGTYGYTREEQTEALHKLREPFDPAEIRYLPRVWCKACRDARGVCNKPDHAYLKCSKCGQKMTTAHIDLRFVGHAEATNRLLNVDPFWDWEPLAVDERGLPQFDKIPGLWIRLTVCGMTRLGYGHAEGKTGGDAVKEIIGDAIRNAGMRFGMALNLWTSSDLLIVEYGDSGGDGTPRQPAPAEETPAEPDPLEEFKPKITRGWNNLDATRQNLLEAKKKGLAGRVVPIGADNTPTRIGELLETRIDELETAAREQRSAA